MSMENTNELFFSIYDQIMRLYQSNPEKNSEELPNMSANEEYYLDILYKLQETTLTTFAKEADISKPAATKIIQKLIDKNFLSKRQSEIDKRVYFLELETEVKQYFYKNYQIFDQYFFDSIGILSAEEQKQLTNMLTKINNHLHGDN